MLRKFRIELCLLAALLLGASPAFPVAEGRYNGITDTRYPFWVHVNAASKIDTFYLKHFLWCSNYGALGVFPAKYAFAPGAEIPIVGGAFDYKAISDTDTVRIQGRFVDSAVTGSFRAGRLATVHDGSRWASENWKATSSSRKYTVTHQGNGATGGSLPPDSAYLPGTTVAAGGNPGKLVKTAARFVCWRTAPDQSGWGYYDGDSFAVEMENIVLYASWRDSTYPLHYKGYGITSGDPPSSAYYPAGKQVTVSGRGTMVKRGYAFAGWNTKADGSGVRYDSGSAFLTEASWMYLYAQWRRLEGVYFLLYDLNGSTGTPPLDTATYLAGSIAKVFDKQVWRNYFDFTGWNTSANGSGTTFASGSAIPIGNADVTLYAQWQPWIARVVVTTDRHGRTTPDTLHMPYLESIAIAAIPDSGYLFDHWSYDYHISSVDDSLKPTTWLVPWDSVVIVKAIFRKTATDQVVPDRGLPTGFGIGFDPTTRCVKLSVPVAMDRNPSWVRVELLDIDGRSIRLVVDRAMQPGYHTLRTDGIGGAGGAILRLRSAGVEQSLLVGKLR